MTYFNLIEENFRERERERVNSIWVKSLHLIKKMKSKL
jgi:hypothetical protein